MFTEIWRGGTRTGHRLTNSVESVTGIWGLRPGNGDGDRDSAPGRRRRGFAQDEARVYLLAFAACLGDNRDTIVGAMRTGTPMAPTQIERLCDDLDINGLSDEVRQRVAAAQQAASLKTMPLLSEPADSEEAWATTMLDAQVEALREEAEAIEE